MYLSFKSTDTTLTVFAGFKEIKPDVCPFK
jgi:hypothetical protein